MLLLIIVIFGCAAVKPMMEGMQHCNCRGKCTCNKSGNDDGDNDNYSGNDDGDTDDNDDNDDSDNDNYNDNYRNGIRYKDISKGDEDLYILKSEIVPPVCPKCPDVASCPREKPCPSCPPCARCPEPAFTCKKVPDYTSINQSELPLPMLNTFSSFR